MTDLSTRVQMCAEQSPDSEGKALSQDDVAKAMEAIQFLSALNVGTSSGAAGPSRAASTSPSRADGSRLIRASQEIVHVYMLHVGLEVIRPATMHVPGRRPHMT